jgi:hypothetical protein
MKKILISIIAASLFSLQAFSAVTISTSGQNRTVTIAYTASILRINTTLEQAAKNLYAQGVGLVLADGERVPFESLTNAQKLKIIDVAVKRYLMDVAKSQVVNDAISAAVATSQTTVNDEIIQE